jgi:hypothetical protein
MVTGLKPGVNENAPRYHDSFVGGTQIIKKDRHECLSFVK